MRQLLALIALSPACVVLSGFFGSDCGNQLTELADGETCDDGNTLPGDGCDSVCQTEVVSDCGNGTLDNNEECDDGNNLNGDGCDSVCHVEISANCGNGDVDPGEDCDDSNNLNGDGCEANCTFPVCGNNIVDPGEECDQDDGNCLPDCTIGCGTNFSFNRKFVDPLSHHCYLAIDDNINWPAANADCLNRGGHLATISSFQENQAVSSINVGQVWLGLNDQGTEGRFVWSDREPLAFSRFRSHEPNNAPNDEDCIELDFDEWNDQDCSIEQDAYVCEFEVADCSNGFLEEGETCDDSNTISGDGCNSNCQAEGAPNCGDGITVANEECDDGNAFDGDGCDSNCQREADVFLMCDGNSGQGNGSFTNPFRALSAAINVVPANGTVMILGPNVCVGSVDFITNSTDKPFILKGSLDTNGGLLSSLDGASNRVLDLTNSVTLVVQDLKLLANRSDAAVSLLGISSLALLHVDIHNEDSSEGFAIENHGTDLLLNRAFIHDNVGGGIVNNCDETDCTIGGRLIVTNSVFEKNGNTQGGIVNDFGALSTFLGSQTLAVGVTFLNNISGNGPSSSDCADQNSSVRLESIIIQDANPINSIGGCTVANFSDFPGLGSPPPGTSNNNGDPDFLSIDGFDFHLGPNSTAFDSANNDPAALLFVAPFDPSLVFGALLGPSNLFSSLFVTDFFGGPRRVGIAIDIGAVEER
jgi:cysteine-rich repeat protein